MKTAGSHLSAAGIGFALQVRRGLRLLGRGGKIVNTGTVIWAVDLLHQEESAVKASAAFLKQYAENKKVLVQLAHVRETMVSVADQLNPVELKAQLEELALRLGIKEFCIEPAILESSGITSESRACALLNHAEELDCDLLLLNSPGKKMPERFLFGSFSEELLMNGKTPVVFISSHCKEISRLQHIVYPTDLSAESCAAFKKCIGFFSNWAEKITLVSEVLPSNASALSSAAAGAWINIEPFPVDEMNRVKSELQVLVDEAREESFQVESRIENSIISTALSLKGLIQEEAPQILAFATESNRLERALFGSVGRELVYQSSIPVWVAPMGKH